MIDHGDNKDGWHLPAWGRAVATVAGAGFIVVALYYKAHPQLLRKELGTLGIELLGIGAGGYLIFEAITGVRNGAVSGNFTPGQFKRSENAPMFWFIVVSDFAFGGAMLLAGLGLMFGVLRA